MASLQRHRVGGRTYWRIVESRRVGGKPRAVPVMYLGTADALLERLLGAPAGRLRLQSFSHGAVAALIAAAERLGVVGIIDRHAAPSKRGLSVGTTLLVAAINRALRPRSKRGWAEWAKSTSLARLVSNLNVDSLTSQYFWDQMHCVSLESLRAIEDELTKEVVSNLGLELDTLFYDTTNFFTYIASTNSRTALAQRGHSKQRRYDLRQIGLALLVARDGQIPLCSSVYEGNEVDVTLFPSSLTAIRERLEALSLSLKDVTLVYDRGNNSRRNQALVDSAPFGYVAALTPTQHRDLLAIPTSRYRPLTAGPLAGIPALRLTRRIWGAERTVLLYVSDQLRTGQIRGLEQHLSKALRDLHAWRRKLAKPRSGPRSSANAQKQIDAILAAQHLKQIMRVEYEPKRKGAERLIVSIDGEARTQLENEVFGKRILITNRSEWSDSEILLAYRGQNDVESAFRQLKDDDHLALRPQHHWTDHKIRVHAFTCVLALLLARVIQLQARAAGWDRGLSALLDSLDSIRLAMVLTPSGKRGGRPRCSWQLEDTEESKAELLRALVPDRPPFVYTPLAD